MHDILNSGQMWFGAPVRKLKAGNRRPVAVPDSLSVPKDSIPVIINVLGNDFDPENDAISIVSATAIYGSVVINGDDTLSYTPLVGFIGADTITYVIEDELQQVHSSTVTIEVLSPTLEVIVEPDNSLTVDAEIGPIDIDINMPAAAAGSFQTDTALLSGGPVNLKPPQISGALTEGGLLSATEGLWIWDITAGVPSQTWQWRRNGADITGATGATYTIQAGDLGQSISVAHSIADLNGSTTSESFAVGGTFVPGDDALLLGWWDASDATTITHSSQAVSVWADKSGGPDLTQTFSPQMPETGVRTINGLNVIDFNGGRLMQSNRTFPASGNVAFHMALAIDSVSNLYEAVLAVDATNDFQIDAGSSTQFDGRLNMAGIGSTLSLSGGPFSGGLVLSAVFLVVLRSNSP